MKRKWVCVMAMGCAVLYCCGLIAAACAADTAIDTQDEPLSQSAAGMTMGYEDKLFDPAVVHTLDIQIDEQEWEDLKYNALQKTYHDCTLVIDGESFPHVGVRTKGNSTLLQSIVREWDRHSLVFSFGQFNASQRYYGLDKLSLYNNACDSSFLRNMICYDMMRQMGVPTPLCSYTAVSLNGEYVGLYVAMEGVDVSFAVRNFGYDYGLLYKPEQFDVAGILNGEYTDTVTIDSSQLLSENGMVQINQFLQIPNEAVALQYLGNSLPAYDDIWDNAVFNIGTNDKHRLISALKNIHDGAHLEQTVDMEELARYFAVNTFVLNTDGYATEMAHNYYLYEKDGVLQMLPWDYDQTLGTMDAVGEEGSATEFINTAIDTPVLNTTVEERPMLACLLKDEQGLALYHAALEELLDRYIDSGYLEAYVEQNVELITPYVQSDPTSGVSMDKFDKAVQSVLDICNLRSQSIRGQLSAQIPSTTAEQLAHPETLIDCKGYVNPDSSGFTEMILPTGSGLGLEDVLRTVRLNFPVILKMLPVSSVSMLTDHEGSGELIQKVKDSGLILDGDEFMKQLQATVFTMVRAVFIMLAALLSLALGLIFVFRFGRGRQPQARKERKRHAV